MMQICKTSGNHLSSDWLRNFPKAQTLATPFNDPIAESIEEYQSFLKSLDYSLLAQGAFEKKI
jgi:hypothetical protein